MCASACSSTDAGYAVLTVLLALAVATLVANTPDNEWVTWHIVHGGRYTRALCGLRPVRGGPGWTDDELSDLSANCLRCKAELRGAP